MSDPFLGEIRLFPFARGAPVNWHLCDGALLQISDYDALYTVLGTTFGGDGSTTFGLPDLRGRVPVHQGTGTGLTPRAAGQTYGAETVTLTGAQLGGHAHLLTAATAAATVTAVADAVPAAIADDNAYIDGIGGADALTFAGSAVGIAGSGEPHENCAPTIALQPCIALLGIFPSQN